MSGSRDSLSIVLVKEVVISFSRYRTIGLFKSLGTGIPNRIKNATILVSFSNLHHITIDINSIHRYMHVCIVIAVRQQQTTCQALAGASLHKVHWPYLQIERRQDINQCFEVTIFHKKPRTGKTYYCMDFLMVPLSNPKLLYLAPPSCDSHRHVHLAISTKYPTPCSTRATVNCDMLDIAMAGAAA